MNADTGPLGKQESEALAKNLLTGDASYKCPSSSAAARHLRYSKGLAGVCGFKQDSRNHAASLSPPTKNIENNPMQSSRRAPAKTLWEVILDTSGKSTALLHHRTIRQTPVGPQWRAVRCVWAKI